MATAALNVVLVTALLIALVIGMYLKLSWQVCVGVALVAAIVGVGIRLIVRWRHRAKYPIGVETRFTPAEETADAVLVAEGVEGEVARETIIPAYLEREDVDLDTPPPPDPGENVFARLATTGQTGPVDPVNGSGRRIRAERGGAKHRQPGGSTAAHVRGKPYGERH